MVLYEGCCRYCCPSLLTAATATDHQCYYRSVRDVEVTQTCDYPVTADHKRDPNIKGRKRRWFITQGCTLIGEDVLVLGRLMAEVP